MSIFFTSDQHYYHNNILKYCPNRAYSCVEEMNEGLINNFNNLVSPDDVVYHLGDFVFGKNINIVQSLHGTHHLICGNHDTCFPWKGFKEKNIKPYLDAGFYSVNRELELELEGLGMILMNHFPYDTKENEDHRYKQFFPVKKNRHRYLLNGHIHQKWKIKNNMINVGVDVWDCKPVKLEEIIKLIKESKI